MNTLMYNRSLQKSNSPIIDSLIEEFEDVFVGSDGKLGLTDYVTHHIELKPNSKPFSQYPYHASPIKRQALAEIIKEQLRQDVIEPSSLGDWNAPAFHVNKSTAGSYRLVVDYRKLNACTRPQFCAIPGINQTLDALGENKPKIFSCLDLFSGFTNYQ